MITIYGERFLLLATKVDNVGAISQEYPGDIFKIKESLFFSIRFGKDYSNLKSNIKSFIKDISTILSEGMYFSPQYDLTNSVNNQKYGEETLYNRVNKSYIWNQFMCDELIKLSVNTKWVTPIIQGYVGIKVENINGKNARIGLISRRESKKVGTRFNARGINEEGNVANSVETEQIVVYGDIYSFLQVRGSVPVFWKQTGVMAEIEAIGTEENNLKAFTKHFNNMGKKYGEIMVFNLLSSTRKKEVLLKNAYESYLKLYKEETKKHISYFEFDYNSKCGSSDVSIL